MSQVNDLQRPRLKNSGRTAKTLFFALNPILVYSRSFSTPLHRSIGRHLTFMISIDISHIDLGDGTAHTGTGVFLALLVS